MLCDALVSLMQAVIFLLLAGNESRAVFALGFLLLDAHSAPSSLPMTSHCLYSIDWSPACDG